MTLHLGNCLDVLRTLPDASIDACVTDPPYGISFMGKRWDYDVPDVDVWAEVLRVLKPGGHLLCFAGTRTQHRMAVRIEDAGFEIRDMLAWVYGSGFPKSLDVSKAIDAAAGAEREVVGRYQPPNGTAWNLANDVSRAQIGAVGHSSRAESLKITAPSTDAARQWDGWGTALKPCMEMITLARKPLIGTVAENVQRFGTGAINIESCRVVAGQRPIMGAWESAQILCDSCAEDADKSQKHRAPATEAFTALNHAAPTLNGKAETLRRDTSTTDTGCSDGLSLAGQNGVLSADTSLSTDESGKMPTGLFQTTARSITPTEIRGTIGSRTCASCGAQITAFSTQGSTSRETKISQHGEKPHDSIASGNGSILNGTSANGSAPERSIDASTPSGRFPGNFLHDGSEEVIGLFPQSTDGVAVQRNRDGGVHNAIYGAYRKPPAEDAGFGGSGSAARFFYCAKASKADRGEGNTHPTVKPTALMRWLVRLVTPPGGTVLDPFMGSGSTGKACALEGFAFVGIERDADYLAIAEARIDAARKQAAEQSPLEQPA